MAWTFDGREPDWAWLRRQAIRLILVGVFCIGTLPGLIAAAQFGVLGVDARIYRLAALAAAQGGDPWSAPGVLRFAGTPPSLLPFLPSILMPETVAVVTYFIVFLVVGVLVLRRLELPIWWLLFPPLAESIAVVNLDVVVLWLLLGSGPARGIAVACKTYAVLPLILQRDWRSVAVGAAASLITLPLWISFFERRDEIAHTFALQATPGLSAWGSWLMIPTAVALLGLRGKGASWLVIPALWPWTQLHYSILALPTAKRSPLVAILLSFPVPLLPAIAVILEFGRVRVLPWFAARRVSIYEGCR